MSKPRILRISDLPDIEELNLDSQLEVEHPEEGSRKVSLEEVKDLIESNLPEQLDAYTKEESDIRYYRKSGTYSKVEIDSTLTQYAKTTNHYTKAQADERFKPASYTPSYTELIDKPAVIAAGETEEAVRSAIGAGTSSLELGTTEGTALEATDERVVNAASKSELNQLAEDVYTKQESDSRFKEKDYQPTWENVQNKPNLSPAISDLDAMEVYDEESLLQVSHPTEGNVTYKLKDIQSKVAEKHYTKTEVDQAVSNSTPDWSSISGKPKVLAEGETEEAARAAIGAGTSSLELGTTEGTALEATDSRVINAVQNTLEIQAGNGLQGGGTLEDNRELSIEFGTGKNQVPHGNDERFTDAREWTAPKVTIAELEEAEETDARKFSPADLKTFVNEHAPTPETNKPNALLRLDGEALVPSEHLPSYVDDVLEFDDVPSFPEIGEKGKLYVDKSEDKVYRWSGTQYIYITSGAVDSVNGRKGVVTGLAEASTQVKAGAGLLGGGTLEADRTLSIDFGDTEGKVMQGNDPRILASATKTELNNLENSVYTKVQSDANYKAKDWKPQYSDIQNIPNISDLNEALEFSEDSLVKVEHPESGDVKITLAEIMAAAVANGYTKTQVNQLLEELELPFNQVTNLPEYLAVGETAEAARAAIGAGTSNLELGSTSGTALEATDSRVVNAVQNTVEVKAGTGLTGGGTLEETRTLSIDFGEDQGTVAEGNDSRILKGVEAHTWGNHSEVGYQKTTKGNVGQVSFITEDDSRESQTAFILEYLRIATNLDEVAASLMVDEDTPNVVYDLENNKLHTYNESEEDWDVVVVEDLSKELPVGRFFYNPLTENFFFNGTKGVRLLSQNVADSIIHKVDETRQVNTGTGLLGGGNLTENRELSVDFGNQAGKVMEGNDERVVNAVQNTTSIIPGDGLQGGGTLSESRTLNIKFGTGKGEVAQGNDSRFGKWDAQIVSEQDAKDGISDEEAKWTAERVRQNVSEYAYSKANTYDKDEVDGLFEDYEPDVKWVDVGNKPAVIAAGKNRTEAREAIGAGTSNLELGSEEGTALEATDERVLNAVQKSRSISAGVGLNGGGTLESDRTLSVDFGNQAGKVMEGNDARVLGAAQKITKVQAGMGLSGGGDLSEDRTLSVNFGTEVNTVMQGNDTRVLNAVQSTRKVSTGAGLTGGGNLGDDLTLEVEFGTTEDTVMQGNDSRVLNAVQNTRKVTVGTGLTGGGDLSEDRELSIEFGTTSGKVMEGDDSRVVGAAQKVTKVQAGLGITGGGDLSEDLTLSINFGNELGTVTEGNDERLSDAREWTAEIVSEVEAKDGESTIARKWTSERVAQAATAVIDNLSNIAGGLLRLDSDLLVPAARLPSYVDDVLEFDNLESFPEEGEKGKIYVDVDTNKTYRWSGTKYVYITSGAVDSVNGRTGVITGLAEANIEVQAGAGLTGGGNLTENRTLGVDFGNTEGKVAQGNDSRIVNAVQNVRKVSAGVGLLGGGDLSEDRTLSINFGDKENTVVEGNDSRVVNAVQQRRKVSAGVGLNGGGTLEDDRELSVKYGVTAGTAVEGNDTRVVNAVQNTLKVKAGTGLLGGGVLSEDRTLNVNFGNTAGTVVEGDDSRVVNAVQNARKVSTGIGLLGGGDLSEDRTITIEFGNSAGTVVEGNDSRVVNAVQKSRTISAGTGLNGGGDLSEDRTISVKYGTIEGTAAQGNDERIVNSVQNSLTLTAGTGLLGGGDLSKDRTLSVKFGDDAGEVVEGNDSRLVNAVPNLRQVKAGTGLYGGGSLLEDVTLAVEYGTTAGTAVQGNDARVVNAVNKSREVKTGVGLQGGGDLSDDRTLSINPDDIPRYSLGVNITNGELDLEQGNVFTLTDIGDVRDVTIVNSHNTRAETIVVKILGEETTSWPSFIKWQEGTPPALGEDYTVVTLLNHNGDWIGNVTATIDL